jgi:hypothetical protein
VEVLLGNDEVSGRLEGCVRAVLGVEVSKRCLQRGVFTGMEKARINIHKLCFIGTI